MESIDHGVYQATQAPELSIDENPQEYVQRLKELTLRLAIVGMKVGLNINLICKMILQQGCEKLRARELDLRKKVFLNYSLLFTFYIYLKLKAIRNSFDNDPSSRTPQTQLEIYNLNTQIYEMGNQVCNLISSHAT